MKFMFWNKLKDKNLFVWDAFHFIVATLVSILVFLVANIWAQSLAEKAEVVNVVIASKDLEAPKVLEEKDLLTFGYRREALPKTAIPAENLKDLIGVTLTHPLAQGEMVTTKDVIGKIDPNLAGFKVPRNAKGFTLPSSWLSSPLPQVKNGDTISIAYSTQGGDKNSAGILAQGVPVVGADISDQGQVSSVLINVEEELAVTLVQLRANNYQLAVAVDGIAPESNLFKK